MMTSQADIGSEGQYSCEVTSSTSPVWRISGDVFIVWTRPGQLCVCFSSKDHHTNRKNIIIFSIK